LDKKNSENKEHQQQLEVNTKKNEEEKELN
jgi:hypothetical protein